MRRSGDRLLDNLSEAQRERVRKRGRGGTIMALNSPLGFERRSPKDFLIAFDSPLCWSEGGDREERSKREREREIEEKR